MSGELPSLEDTIALCGLRSKKSLGQHFLLDASLTQSIAQLAGDVSGHNVFEIGPGPGGLTRALIATPAARIIAIEKDERTKPALAMLQQHDARLDVIYGDAQGQSLTALAPAPRSIVANLPYNVGTDLLLGWLGDIARDPGAYHSLILMFQKEVGERITATPATKAYGRLSVLTQWLCDAHLAMFVPAAAFSPPPKVDSVVVQLVPRPRPAFAADKQKLERVLAVAFQQRRKMLRSALKPLGADIMQKLQSAGIDDTLRPDQLSVQHYCALANLL